MPPSTIRASRCTLAVPERPRGESKARVSAPSNAQRNDAAEPIMRAPSNADADDGKDAGEFPGTPVYAPSSAEGCAPRVRANGVSPTRSAARSATTSLNLVNKVDRRKRIRLLEIVGRLSVMPHGQPDGERQHVGHLHLERRVVGNERVVGTRLDDHPVDEIRRRRELMLEVERRAEDHFAIAGALLDQHARLIVE